MDPDQHLFGAWRRHRPINLLEQGGPPLRRGGGLKHHGTHRVHPPNGSSRTEGVGYFHSRQDSTNPCFARTVPKAAPARNGTRTLTCSEEEGKGGGRG